MEPNYDGRQPCTVCHGSWQTENLWKSLHKVHLLEITCQAGMIDGYPETKYTLEKKLL